MCTKDLTVLFIGEFPHTLAKLVVTLIARKVKIIGWKYIRNVLDILNSSSSIVQWCRLFAYQCSKQQNKYLTNLNYEIRCIRKCIFGSTDPSDLSHRFCTKIAKRSILVWNLRIDWNIREKFNCFFFFTKFKKDVPIQKNCLIIPYIFVSKLHCWYSKVFQISPSVSSKRCSSNRKCLKFLKTEDEKNPNLRDNRNSFDLRMWFRSQFSRLKWLD